MHSLTISRLFPYRIVLTEAFVLFSLLYLVACEIPPIFYYPPWPVAPFLSHIQYYQMHMLFFKKEKLGFCFTASSFCSCHGKVFALESKCHKLQSNNKQPPLLSNSSTIVLGCWYRYTTVPSSGGKHSNHFCDRINFALLIAVIHVSRHEKMQACFRRSPVLSGTLSVRFSALSS